MKKGGILSPSPMSASSTGLRAHKDLELWNDLVLEEEGWS